QSGAPYYTISYDQSGYTDQVTRGTGTHKLVYIARPISPKITPPPEIAQLISVLQELETFLPNRVLEIEFALTRDWRCILFQVRPFSVKLARSARQSARTQLLQQAKQFITERNQPQSGWLGEQTVFGVMPDWNPAEIIGLHPRPLAASLYQSLITLQVWQQARISMGYRNVPQQDLMLLIAGRPFVDVRMSFNSWLPATLLDSIGSLLVNSWLDQLKQNPHLHDKVEFELVHSCYTLDCPSRLQQQYGNLLSKSQVLQFSDALRTLTLECLNSDASSSFNASLESIHTLQAQQRSQKKHSDSNEHLLLQAQQRLQQCRTLGTLPFAVLARHAFIAESLLQSAVRCEALSPSRYEQFKRSIKTISSEIATAMNQVRQGQLQPAQFMYLYGHLRPGTYDIRALRYADRSNLFTGSAAVQEAPATMDFVLTAYEHRHTDWLLKRAHFEGVNADGLMKYASEAIAAREMSKFVFSRALSDVLEAMTLWGATHDLDRDALSFLTVDDLMLCTDGHQDIPLNIQQARQTI
ncbi:MAG: hypothetical protein KAG66_20865, partial [Methylococcales bacterium]|nr:hypothetical protein [Methylococcales bacterium]